ncbi:hypothetical protein WJX72_001141 [[Myrmecia] bisecta]|uniref:Rhodanese domain-containing protein n=1 Tax=[Myrmecia] bisecta TaxID=41462 RepID=A0AAW1Q9W2_9CHLO
MSVQELGELLLDPSDSNEVQFVDVREPEEYSMVSLPNFKLWPLQRISEWAELVTEELDISKPTVVLCHHGMRSMYVSSFLVSRGFQQVSNVSGGIDAYSQLVDPSVPRY